VYIHLYYSKSSIRRYITI